MRDEYLPEELFEDMIRLGIREAISFGSETPSPYNEKGILGDIVDQDKFIQGLMMLVLRIFREEVDSFNRGFTEREKDADDQA